MTTHPTVGRIVRGINRTTRGRRTPPAPVPTVQDPAATAALKRVAELEKLAGSYRSAPVRDDRIHEHLAAFVKRSGITGGRVLEIGGRKYPRGHVFESLAPGAFSYQNLDIEISAEDPPETNTVIGDITGCPEIETGSYDVVISVDVFEHIDRPWLAASEISRILRPGGLSYTSTLFSWRYHPCPIDFWRYTPDALEFLFDELTLLEKGFDTTERRRDFRKKAKSDPMPLDALGGWRENVRVFHAGIKRHG